MSMRLRATLIAAALALASTANAQNLRGLARATSTTGGNDSLLTLVSDSAFRTRALSGIELFRRPAGTAVIPTYSFALSTGLGFYRFGADTLGIASAGVNALNVTGLGKILGGAGNMTITAGTGNSRAMTLQSTNSSGTVKNNLVLGADSSMTLLGQGLGEVGTAALPSWSFAGDPNTGFYSFGADTLGLATNGATQFRFSAGSLGAALVAVSGRLTIQASGTSNEIDLFGTNSGGTAVNTLDITSTAALPGADNARDLGSASQRWSELYINPAASGAGDTYMCLSTGQQVHAGVTCAASTLKMKDSVVAYTNADAVLRLRPVTFNFKSGYYGQRAEIGLIAEEAALVDPRFVFAATKFDTLTAIAPAITLNALTQKLDTTAVVIKPGEPEALNVSSIVAALVAQVQVQKRQLDSLSAVVFTLQQKAP